MLTPKYNTASQRRFTILLNMETRMKALSALIYKAKQQDVSLKFLEC